LLSGAGRGCSRNDASGVRGTTKTRVAVMASFAQAFRTDDIDTHSALYWSIYDFIHQFVALLEIEQH
jgi:hypothetical protein